MDTDKILAESIAKDYVPKDNSKIIALRKLDKLAKRPAIIFAYSNGIISTLIFGLGMCLAMQTIGSGMTSIVLGVVIGFAGLLGCCFNYPFYKKLLESGRAKYAFEIVQLAREITDK